MRFASSLRRTGQYWWSTSFFGALGPATIVFSEFEDFEAYLTENARAGDKISVWSVWPFMRDTPPLATGKCPDADGAVPAGGAY